MSAVFVTTAYGGPEGQQLIEREAPEPRAGEIALEVRAAGVNPADWKRREGAFGTKGRMPMALGLEASGVVTAVGEGAEGFAVGDDVLGTPARGLGAFAEHTVLNAATAARKPAEVSFADAATLPVAGTAAYDLSHQIVLGRGDTVLVLGAGGGVGRMILQIAAGRGLRALGVASPSKRALVEEAGAVVVASGEGVVDAARALAPDGVDLLVDLVGGDALRALAPLAAEPSRLVSAADAPTATSLGGSGRRSADDALERLTAVVAAGRVTPHVEQTFPLNRAAEALAAVETGHARGKIVIIP